MLAQRLPCAGKGPVNIMAPGLQRATRPIRIARDIQYVCFLGWVLRDCARCTYYCTPSCEQTGTCALPSQACDARSVSRCVCAVAPPLLMLPWD